MQNDWILDVLADLSCFAQKNGFTQLAERLEEATVVARTELTVRKPPRLVTNGDDHQRLGSESD